MTNEAETPTEWLRREGGERTERDEALRNLADATRTMIDGIHATKAPPAVINGLARSLSGLVEILAAQPRGRVYEGFAEAATSGAPTGFFDFSPVMGVANPLAPPVQLTVDGEVVRGSGVFGHAYEGPPGCVHGGFIAATFDELLGMAQTVVGSPGMTGTLTVRYRAPTPLHSELTLIGEVERVEGRKIWTSGRMYADDHLTAEAEAVFVSVEPERMMDLAARRAAEGG